MVSIQIKKNPNNYFKLGQKGLDSSVKQKHKFYPCITVQE